MKEISSIIIDNDPTSNEIIKQYLEDNSKIANCNQFLDIKEGYDYACQKKTDMIFIDLAFGENTVIEVISNILKNNNEAKIIVTGREISAELLIKIMKAGAKETLEKPIIKSDFDAVITKIAKQINYNAEFENSRVISVFSNKGGIGKTTIATNLAIEIENITKEPTVIVDFNSQFGDVSTFLNVKADFGISYLLNNKKQLSKDFLLSVLPKYKDTNLYVLSDLFCLSDVKDLTLENVQDILDALKSAFTYIIVDMTGVFDLKTVKILDNANDILFPIVSNIPNLRNCQRCLDFFKKIGYENEKVKIILNRVSENDEIKASKIEMTLQKKIYAKIVNDYFMVMAAINRGLGLNNIESDSEIAKSFQSLAYSLIKTEA